MTFTAAILLLYASLQGAGADYPVEVQIEPYFVQIGDPVTIVHRFPVPRGAKVDLSEFPEGLAESVLISSDTVRKAPETDEARLLFERIVTIAPFAVGDHTVPAAAAEIIRPDGTSYRLEMPAAMFSVRSVSAAEAGPESTAPLKDIIEPEPARLPVWVWISGGLLIVAAGFALWWFLFGRAPGSVRRLVKLTPAQRALRDLDKLAASEHLEQGREKQYYTELADILRRYIALRYHLLALEMTSQELKRKMSRIWRASPELEGYLHSILHLCDMVKFARHHTESSDAEAGISTSRQIVELSRDDRTSLQSGKEAA